MPFTFAHPAAVLPFRRFAKGPTSLCALVIGSMAPDFVYFFPLGVNGAFSHSIPGILLFCVPAGFAAYLAYYLFFRQPLIALLPDAFAARLPPRTEWLPQRLPGLLAIAALFALGACTHVVWDLFTHGNTIVVNHFQIFKTPIAEIGEFRFPLYRVLQHASSVFGLACLGLCSWRWMRRAPPEFVHPLHLTVVQRSVIALAILAIGVGGGLFSAMTKPAKTVDHWVFNGVVSGMTLAMSAVLVFAAYWWIQNLRLRRGE